VGETKRGKTGGKVAFKEDVVVDIVEVVVKVGIVVKVVVELSKTGDVVVDDKTVEGDGLTIKVVLDGITITGFKVDVVVVGSGCVVVVLDDVGELDEGGRVETQGSVVGGALLVVVVFSHVSTVVDETKAALVLTVY
jgi:hypothetical protein